MSLRDFNTPYSDDPTALHHMPGGNETGLQSFHTIQPDDIEPNNTPKIVGAIAVALMVGAAGVALYASHGSSSQSKQMVAAATPAATAPVAPPPAAAPLADATMPASAPVASPVQATKAAKAATTDPNSLRAALVKTPAAHSHVAASASRDMGAASARMAADSSQVSTQPQQQAAVTAAPEQPSAAPSDVATINTQSGVAVPQGATTASDVPNPAQNANPTPAPVPAPAEPSGQIAQ